VSVAHVVAHWLPAQVKGPQSIGVGEEQVFALQVEAGVKMWPLHDAAGQSLLVLHWTQPKAVQTGVAPVQLIGGEEEQLPEPSQVAAGVKIAPLHDAGAQTVVAGAY
jgi:hypothetical protein